MCHGFLLIQTVSPAFFSASHLREKKQNKTKSKTQLLDVKVVKEYAASGAHNDKGKGRTDYRDFL